MPANMPPTGMNIRAHACSKVCVTSTAMLRGSATLISALHCGHCTFSASFFRLGAFRSAIQSRRQAWCAVRAQGHGETHSESAGVSSVSSEKQIQHLRGSGAGGAVEEPAVARAVEMGELGLGEWF